MRKLLSLTELALTLIGGALVVYGVFALTYSGDGSGQTYVSIGGHDADARLIGGLATIVGLLMFASALISRRERRATRARSNQ